MGRGRDERQHRDPGQEQHEGDDGPERRRGDTRVLFRGAVGDRISRVMAGVCDDVLREPLGPACKKRKAIGRKGNTNTGAERMERAA